MDIMHRGAAGIAERVLGADTPENRRIIYRWASEIPADQRPFVIRKSGRVIYAWERDITGADQRHAASTTENDSNPAA